MESEISYSYNKPFNSTQNNSGLLRFRSAPSSFLANWDGKNEDQSNFEVSQFVQNMEENKSLNSQYTAQKLDLMRENSTPAELFSHFSAQNGYAMKSVGGYGFPSGEVEFSSPVQSTLGMLSRITEEDENETIGLNTSQDRDPPYYGSGLPFSSWNHSTKFGDNLMNGLKTELDCDDEKLISDIQGGELRNRPHMLSHHLSIPKASTDVTSMDKFLHFQDAVPCKLRAKRGCATHPRSIAERVRRTKISERMRKLQELVPNMEKQTNTSDMLDFAVDYIKELQKQYKSLSDIRARCKCSAMPKPVSDQKY